MSGMKAYLAEKYMSGPKADAILTKVGHKKKRKAHGDDAAGPSTSMIVDDDGGWGDQVTKDADIEAEAVVASDRQFKKRKAAHTSESSGWSTIQEGIKQSTPPPTEDEKPQIVEEPFVGGLVTASELKKVLPKQKVVNTTTEEMELVQETVYRDASGRKIDTKAARAEAARLKREREERDAQKMVWGKGLVQRDEAAKLKEELEKNKSRPFSRYADDEELNAEQRAKQLWNDPAAAFLTNKKAKGPRRPQYTGPPPPPNRFSILPGYRWDGVDRSNGFEKKYFQSQNARKRGTLESYQWGADDM
ncbi:hypothetical protein FISHEDRAFT_67691 [Fistulina hepatica ATCC 64428]|nr:hypothetical protein FISHEDRAFT_67691 [Fistulina hepatica ATCC 64428]